MLGISYLKSVLLLFCLNWLLKCFSTYISYASYILQVLPSFKSISVINILWKINVVLSNLFILKVNLTGSLLSCTTVIVLKITWYLQSCINLILKGIKCNLYFYLTCWSLEFMIGWLHLHSISLNVSSTTCLAAEQECYEEAPSSFLTCCTCAEYANQVSLYDTLFPISSLYSGVCSLIWKIIYPVR
jgi:hypothetical protein